MLLRYFVLICISIIMLTTVPIIVVSNNKTEHLKEMLVDIKSNCLYIINEHENIITRQREELEFLNARLNKKQIVTVTFYHPESKGINSDSDHTNTAIMVTPTIGRTVAISDELFLLGWLGNKIYIEGYGVFIAEDRMSKSIKGKCLDICVGSKKAAFRLGRKFKIIAMQL